MAEQITTADGVEFLVPGWVCPACQHVQDDTVHPEMGPYLSCTCGECGKSFSDEQLDKKSAERWEDARATADAYGEIHRPPR